MTFGPYIIYLLMKLLGKSFIKFLGFHISTLNFITNKMNVITITKANSLLRQRNRIFPSAVTAKNLISKINSQIFILFYSILNFIIH